MPSKGGSRTASAANFASTEPAAAVVAAALGDGGAAVIAGNELESLTFTALEDVPAALAIEEEPAVETPQWADLYTRAVEATARDRERIEREQQEAQRLWEEFLRVQGEEVPDGDRSLLANDDLHRQLQRLARTSAAAEYERENVIGDPNQTFGVEIEFDGADPHAVARAFYEAGLASTPNLQGYHSSGRVPGKWVVERDSTVTGEIVSPVMQDAPETWEQLERVCQILRAHGARTTSRTGGHVHVGADSANMDHDVSRFRRVANMCAWAEDLMYRLAAGTGRGGRQHRGAGNGYRWCGPMGSGQFENAQDLSDLAYRVGSSHGVGLNYGNLLEQRRTIEYRYFDSSLDPARLQANIKLACWVTKRASEMPDSAIPQERVRLGTHRSAPESDPGDRLLRRFADMVFVRPKDKLKLYWLYERSAWQQGRGAAA
jgi:hypothetical protein